MKNEILENIKTTLTEGDKTYVRLIREYAIVNHTPGVNGKVRRYVKDIKDTVFHDINQIIQKEKESIQDAAKIKLSVRDTAGEIRRNSELILMKNAIEGTANNQLVDLAAKYANTEYEEDFRIMIQPRLRTRTDDKSPERMKNTELVNEIMAALDKLPDETAKEVSELEMVIEDIRSMLYFNDSTFKMGAQVNNDDRLIYGNWDTRNIEMDIKDAKEGFNPMNEANLEPLTVTERLGTKYFKTVNYQFDWEEN